MNKKKDNQNKKDNRNPEADDFFSPFRTLPFDNLENYFNTLQRRMLNSMNQSQRDHTTTHQEGPYFYGYSCQIGPDGVPHYKEYSNLPTQKNSLPPQQTQHDPFVDIQQTDTDIYVTIELPGVEKEAIDLDITENILALTVNQPEHPYTKEIELPSEVLKRKTDATYNNGVLSITLKKRKSKKNGTRINIK